MKKSSFVAMILGTIGGILFALGMCMALIPEWNAFRPGVIMGVVGVSENFGDPERFRQGDQRGPGKGGR